MCRQGTTAHRARTSRQSRLLEFVRRFVDERGIANFDQLKGHGYNPTGPQRNAVDKQTGRKKDALSFAEAWSNNFVKSKYGAATTHWSKLRDRIDRGVGNPCPLVLIGLPAEMVRFDAAPIVEIDDSAVNQQSRVRRFSRSDLAVSQGS